MSAYETGKSAGDLQQFDGRRIYALESELTHPTHTDGFVDKGDPVVTAGMTGVSLTSASASTDRVVIETDGIYHLSVVGSKISGNAAIAVDDPIFIDESAATLSGDSRDRFYGIAKGAVAAGQTTVIPVLLAGKANPINSAGLFAVTIPNLAAAGIAKPLFVAPAACSLVKAIESHVTVAGQAGTMTLEKCNTGEAPGAGDVMLESAWDITSTANTPVEKLAVADGKEDLVAGDAILAKVASGAATSYAGACITLLLEWA